ncbi:hypothetical protein [Streptantibioticus ferralitis]|uniref:Uncharacterized protein n=1 Tax=Streptantibioticus ferralitis TaxID=236510 RepID=A0ABT5Z7K1_9ACTN|nr:hypothetical protein [Streptantibioticus ferralitis]MDF2259708.1 hypothetical protein [Streptantibioticus ferralitis]
MPSTSSGAASALVRRSEGFAKLGDTLEQSDVRPANPSFYGVRSTEFQS